MKLIFVYNADGDPISSLVDAVHKLVKPSTYKCNLCMITYGAVSMKEEWKDFIKNLKIKVEFLHKDIFQKKYGLKEHGLPAAFIENKNKIELLITVREINSCKTMSDLKKLVIKKIKQRKLKIQKS